MECLKPLGQSTGGKQEVFIGRDYSQRKEHSEHTARIVDGEIKRLLEDAYTKTKDILRANTDHLERIASTLLEKENHSIIDEFRSHGK